jgi:hypothetical protein
MVNCRERRAGEGHMHDDLMGRLVADAGVDCAAAAMTDTGVLRLAFAGQPAAVDSNCVAY